MRFSFSKQEKLKSKQLIETLFASGQSVSQYPLRMVYIETTHTDEVVVKAGISVSKRHFKLAVDRNRIKRLMREAYRLQKPHYFNNLTTQYALMILYIGNENPTYTQIDNAMTGLLQKFVKTVSS